MLKIRSKSRGSPCYFLSSRGQKIRNIVKIKQKILFLFTFLVSFFMVFLAQKLIYTININIWFNFVQLYSFIEQDHLLNFILFGVYAKSWPKVHVFHYKNWFSAKSDLFFSNFDLPEDISIGRILSEKKYRSTVLVSEKTEVLYAELIERAEAATSSYSVTGNFLQYIYSVPSYLWLRIFRTSDQGV